MLCFQIYNSNLKKNTKAKQNNNKTHTQSQTKTQTPFYKEHLSTAVQSGISLNTHYIKQFKHVSMFAIHKTSQLLKNQRNSSKQMLQFSANAIFGKMEILYLKTCLHYQRGTLKWWILFTEFTVSKGNNNIVSAFHSIHLETSGVHHLSNIAQHSRKLRC